MLQTNDWQAVTRTAVPLPPQRHTLPTIPCDLSEYARAETGPLSWSALFDEPPRVRELEEPFDLDTWPEPMSLGPAILP
jgi:hypothetical protein